MSTELEALTVRLAKENPDWGYDKIQGELLKLGYKLCASSVRNILKRHRPVSDHLVPGAASSGTTKTRSWRAISSQWKPSGSKPSMCFSSSNWELGASIWQDARPPRHDLGYSAGSPTGLESER